MDIFDLPFKETEKQIDNILSNTTPDELLEELIQCGLEVTMNEEEAIKQLNQWLSVMDLKKKISIIPNRDDIQAIETVLNLIEKQKAEIEKLRNNNKDLLRKLKNRVKDVKKLEKYSLYKKEFSTLNKQLKEKDLEIETLKRDFEIVDHECSRLEQEDIRKDMIINLMAEYISKRKCLGNVPTIEDYCNGRSCVKCTINYFENKVKESK